MPLRYEDLEVVGSTTVAHDEDLPRRLSPVYRRVGDHDTVYLPLPQDDEDDFPRLAREAASYLSWLVDAGQAVRFDHVFHARAAHRLLQLAPDVGPEYLPADEVPDRLRRACEGALLGTARALAEGRREEAAACAWYARRADGDDPLPLLVLVALLRTAADADDVGLLEHDLAEHARSSVDDARRLVRGRREYAEIDRLLSMADTRDG
jgi:hypothetical protein